MDEPNDIRSHEIESLPLRKILKIAIRGIRIRFWQSLLVIGGIVLAVAFLTYMLCSDLLTQSVVARGSQALLERLSKAGLLEELEASGERVQTYWVVGLALLISFVGIVNSMLMSVTERFREIGTMKCLGALDGFVLRLFLLESLLSGIAGTGLGIVLGFALAYAEGVRAYGSEAWQLLAPGQFLSILGICFTTGVVLTVAGALYPAWRAAKMPPVVALRYEV